MNEFQASTGFKYLKSKPPKIKTSQNKIIPKEFSRTTSQREADELEDLNLFMVSTALQREGELNGIEK